MKENGKIRYDTISRFIKVNSEGEIFIIFEKCPKFLLETHTRDVLHLTFIFIFRVSTHQGGVWCVVIDGDTPEERLSISSSIDYR